MDTRRNLAERQPEMPLDRRALAELMQQRQQQQQQGTPGFPPGAGEDPAMLGALPQAPNPTPFQLPNPTPGAPPPADPMAGAGAMPDPATAPGAPPPAPPPGMPPLSPSAGASDPMADLAAMQGYPPDPGGAVPQNGMGGAVPPGGSPQNATGGIPPELLEMLKRRSAAAPSGAASASPQGARR